MDETHTAGLRLHSFGYDEAASKAYSDHYAVQDPYVRRIRELGSGADAGTSDELITTADLKRTGFYADYARPNGIFFVSWMILQQDESGAAGLAVIRPEDASQFAQDQVELLRVLGPFLTQSFSHERLVRAMTDNNRILLKSVDYAGLAIVALGKSGRIVNFSPAAEKLLNKGDPLQVRNGRLHALNSSEDCEMQKMLAWAGDAWTNAGRPKKDELRLSRRDGKTSLRIAVKSFSSVLDRSSCSCALFAEDRPQVLVYLSDPSIQSASQEALVRSRLGFAPIEVKVAGLMRQGYSQSEIAQQMQIRSGTLRQHLHRMYNKAGVRNQMALMHLLRSLVSDAPQPRSESAAS